MFIKNKMEVKALFTILKEIKQEATSLGLTLTNDEVLKIMEIKVLMEIKTRLSR